MPDVRTIPEALVGLEFHPGIDARDYVQDAVVFLRVMAVEDGHTYPVIALTDNTDQITMDGLIAQYQDYRELYTQRLAAELEEE